MKKKKKKKQTPLDRHVNLVKREIKAARKIPTITAKKMGKIAHMLKK